MKAQPNNSTKIYANNISTDPRKGFPVVHAEAHDLIVKRLEKAESLLREARDFLSSEGYLPETIDCYFAEVEK